MKFQLALINFHDKSSFVFKDLYIFLYRFDKMLPSLNIKVVSHIEEFRKDFNLIFVSSDLIVFVKEDVILS